MKRIPLLTLVVAAAAAFSANADTITLTGTIRDFHYNNTSTAPLAGHADFENVIGGLETGIVKSTLGGDGTPQYAWGAGNSPAGSVHGETGFNQWYHNTSGVNLSENYALTLTEGAPGVYSYYSSSFFPIDGLLGGNQGSSHNYAFTYQIHTEFTYQLGQKFDFAGDDDVWVFINDKLAMDLGGVHGETPGTINVDALGLTAGNTYDFDFFFAERHTTGSNLKITTSIPLRTNNVPEGGATLMYLASALVPMLGLGQLRKK